MVQMRFGFMSLLENKYRQIKKIMKRLIIYIYFFPLSLFAEQTGNLLSQDFSSNNWSGTNQSSLHGTGTVAGVDSKYIESTISLSDNLSLNQINGGWTSTLGSDIWSWNNNDQTTTMKQTITNADGEVTTQIRNISTTSSDNYTTYTDSYTQGINSQSDYDIAVRFSFDESSNSIYHYATDLKNPTLTIEHSLLNTSQVEQISTISENIVELVSNFKEEEILVEIQEIEMPMFEEIYIEEETISFAEIISEFFFEQNTEEINTGIIEIYEVVDYDIEENFQEVTTEIQEFKEIPETGNLEFEQTETITETITEELYAESREEITQDIIGEPEEQPIRESDTIQVAESSNEEPRESIQGKTEERDEPVTETASESNEPSTTDVAEEPKESDVQETETVESESNNETRTATNESETSDSENEQQVSESNVDSETDTNSTEVSEKTIESISVEKIATKVAEVVKELDKQLVVTNIIVAKAMQSKINIDSYSSINNNLFNNQVIMNGGTYDELRTYVDNRNIYQQSQVIYNDDFSKYQKKIDDARAERIRAVNNLDRIINGY